jgi:predicted DNA-binding transcriptional regulator AlpA
VVPKNSRKKSPKKVDETAKPLLTLSDVAKRSGISMPTLLRYKKQFQARIPSSGKGRAQRYPESALPVFAALKAENMKRRGRPKGSSGGASRSQGPSARRRLLSLNEIGRLTGISYPTLLRYVNQHLPQLPHAGEGRARRFLPTAVAVFQRLRAESKRGRKAAVSATGAAGAAIVALRTRSDRFIMRRLGQIEKVQGEIVKQLRALARRAERPIRVVVKH